MPTSLIHPEAVAIFTELLLADSHSSQTVLLLCWMRALHVPVLLLFLWLCLYTYPYRRWMLMSLVVSLGIPPQSTVPSGLDIFPPVLIFISWSMVVIIFTVFFPSFLVSTSTSAYLRTSLELPPEPTLQFISAFLNLYFCLGIASLAPMHFRKPIQALLNLYYCHMASAIASSINFRGYDNNIIGW